HGLPIIDVRRLDRLGQAVVVVERRVAVGSQDENPTEVGAEAERLDVEVGEVPQVQRVRQEQRLAQPQRVEEPLPARPATVRREHGTYPVGNLTGQAGDNTSPPSRGRGGPERSDGRVREWGGAGRSCPLTR